jgi:hypothetical protein
MELRRRARALHRGGMALRAVARDLNVPYHSVRYWCSITKTPDAHWDNRRHCPRCADPPESPEPNAYAYLLGQYLGDGHVVLTARVPVLRIACADAYPGIMDECGRAMLAVLANSVGRNPSIGCTYVQSHSNHWPCLLPQAGPGKKHERPIVLEAWQREIVDAHPGNFVRGLLHSDGCRATNNVVVRGKTYSYPRYFFQNESKDILALCGEALDRLGVAWRFNRANSISVARRASIAILDRHVGPKR